MSSWYPASEFQSGQAAHSSTIGIKPAAWTQLRLVASVQAPVDSMGVWVGGERFGIEGNLELQHRSRRSELVEGDGQRWFFWKPGPAGRYQSLPLGKRQLWNGHGLTPKSFSETNSALGQATWQKLVAPPNPGSSESERLNSDRPGVGPPAGKRPQRRYELHRREPAGRHPQD